MGIPGGASGRRKKQATMLPAEGNVTRSEKIAQELNMVLMRGNLMLHNTVRGGNGMGGRVGSTGWSALTEAVEMFGPAAAT